MRTAPAAPGDKRRARVAAGGRARAVPGRSEAGSRKQMRGRMAVGSGGRLRAAQPANIVPPSVAENTTAFQYSMSAPFARK